MRSKETLILLGVVILLGAFIYFFERHTTSTEENARRRDRVLPALARDKVTRIEIASPKGKVALERREKKGAGGKKEGQPPPAPRFEWVIAGTPPAVADESAVDGILSDVEFMNEERRIEGAAAKDRKKFGLDSPRVTVTLVEGKKATRIAAGGEAPGDGQYLAVDARPDVVFVVSKFTVESLLKGPADFRDKEVLGLLPAAVTRIARCTGTACAPEPLFVREGEKWTSAAPALGGKKVRLDRREVEKLAGAVGRVEAISFIADTVAEGDLAGRGFGADAVKVEVAAEGGKTETIVVGPPCGGETKGTEGVSLFVRGSGTLVCAPLKVKTELDRPLADFRLLTPMEADEYEVRAMESWAKGSLLARLEKKDDETWELVKPEKRAADKEAVLELLDFLRKEKGSFPDPLGAVAQPLPDWGAAVKLVFTGDGGAALESVSIAPGPEGKALFMREGEEAWGTIAAGPACKDAGRPFRYYPKGVVDEDYYEATELAVEGAKEGLLHRLRKDGENGGWVFASPAGLAPDQADTRDTIESLATLTAQRFVAGAGGDLAPFGLAAPRWKVTVLFSGGGGEGEAAAKDGEKKEKKVTLLVGDTTPDGYAALVEGGSSPAVFIVTEALVQRLTRPLAARDVFMADPAKVAALALARGGKTEEFAKKGGAVEHAAGEKGLFAAGQAQAFLEKLGTLRADDVIGYGPAPAAAKLGAPSLTATITLEGEGGAAAVKKTLRFGAPVAGKEERRYAAVEGVPCTYAVGADLLAALGLEGK